MISNSGHDERGKYCGGSAGDQTGKEWAVIPWYNRPWTCVIRFPSQIQGAKIAELAKEAAENNLIGYNQAKRRTFWKELAEAGYHPRSIKKRCDADCSAGVAAICKAAGYLLGDEKMKQISPDMYTGNQISVLSKAGAAVLRDPKYITSDQYLIPGDILLCEGHHTAINLDFGPKAAAPAYKRGWNQDRNGWWYADTTSSYYRLCWKIINGHWYYFNDSGYIAIGWQKISGKWYYFQPDGNLEGALYHTDETGAQEIWNV